MKRAEADRSLPASAVSGVRHLFVDDVWNLIISNLSLHSVNTLRCTNKHINNVILRTQPYGIHLLLSMHYDEEMNTRPSDTVLWVMDLLKITHLQHPTCYWSPGFLVSLRNLLKCMKEKTISTWNVEPRIQQGWKVIISPSDELLRRMQSHPQDKDAFCLRCGSWFNMRDSTTTTSDDADVMVCVYHRSYYHMAYGSYGDDQDLWNCCGRYKY
eukprot:PhF_6_TR13868/c0_g1_i8/m.22257